MSTGRSYRRGMSSRSLRATVGALVAGGALLAAPVPSTADEVVVNTFQVEYDVLVQWEHQRRYGEAALFDGLSYHLKGTLPNVTFRDRKLTRHSHALVQRTQEGSATANTENPGGTSVWCAGGPVRIDGMAALGQDPDTSKLWFGTWFGAEAATECRDSDGKTGAGAQKVATIGSARPDATVVPIGAATFTPSPAVLDSAAWKAPYHRTFVAKDCPGFTAGPTTKCVLDVSGTVRFTRVSRTTEDGDNDNLLGPVEVPKPPKAQPRRGRATATVRCPRACDVEALIGVFGTKDGKPHVSWPARRTRRLKAGRATAVAVPMGAGARKAAAQGLAVMELRVRMAGRTRTARYPLR